MPDFTGQFGGMIAAATIAGFGLGWKACLDVVVKPMKEQLAKQEERIEVLEKKFLDL